MMEKTSRNMSSGRSIFSSKVCGKEGKSSNIKNHIEANHFEGVSVPCNNCEKTFRSRNTLAQHTHMIHKKTHLRLTTSYQSYSYQDQRFFASP